MLARRPGVADGEVEEAERGMTLRDPPQRPGLDGQLQRSLAGHACLVRAPAQCVECGFRREHPPLEGRLLRPPEHATGFGEVAVGELPVPGANLDEPETDEGARELHLVAVCPGDLALDLEMGTRVVELVGVDAEDAQQSLRRPDVCVVVDAVHGQAGGVRRSGLELGGAPDRAGIDVSSCKKLCFGEREQSVGAQLAAHGLVGGQGERPLAFAEAEFFAGRDVDAGAIRRAAELESAAADTSRLAVHRVHPLRSRSNCWRSSAYADDDDTHCEIEREIAWARGDEVQLARTLVRLGLIEVRAGDWELADTTSPKPVRAGFATKTTLDALGTGRGTRGRSNMRVRAGSTFDLTVGDPRAAHEPVGGRGVERADGPDEPRLCAARPTTCDVVLGEAARELARLERVVRRGPRRPPPARALHWAPSKLRRWSERLESSAPRASAASPYIAARAHVWVKEQVHQQQKQAAHQGGTGPQRERLRDAAALASGRRRRGASAAG